MATNLVGNIFVKQIHFVSRLGRLMRSIKIPLFRGFDAIALNLQQLKPPKKTLAKNVVQICSYRQSSPKLFSISLKEDIEFHLQLVMTGVRDHP